MFRVVVCTVGALLAFAVGSSRTTPAAEVNESAVAEFEGTVVPAREAEITPIVSGWLNKINFAPGQFVREGDVLFEFNQNPQKLKIKLAEAQLARAQATLRDAKAKLQRFRKLKSRDVVSEANLLQAEAAQDIAAADVEATKASLGLQRLAMKQLTQKAPFSGMMSAPLVMENGFQEVSGRERIRMATITQLDPIQVVGEVPYSTYAERRKLFKTDEATKKGLVLSIVFPDGEKYPHEGRLVSGGYKFDPKTQKITVWGEFANPDFLLRPGLKVVLRSRLAKP